MVNPLGADFEKFAQEKINSPYPALNILLRSIAEEAWCAALKNNGERATPQTQTGTGVVDLLRHKELLQVALESLHLTLQALSDWACIASPEHRADTIVRAAEERVIEGGGTLPYILHVSNHVTPTVKALCEAAEDLHK